MATFRILSAEKKQGDTVDQVEQLLTEAYPDWRIENIVEVNGEWQARLVQDRLSKSIREVIAGDPPAFLKKKDEESDDSSDSSDDDSSDDSSDDGEADSDEGSDKSDKGSEKDEQGDKGKSDPVAEVKKIMDELQGLLSDLGGKAQDMQNAHDDKAQKLKDIADTVGDDGGAPIPGEIPDHDGPVLPDAVGPHPGGGAMPPPGGGIPPIPRRPGVPSGGSSVPGRPSAFANRTEIAYHSGLDNTGNRITIEAAKNQLEADPEFAEYKVVEIKEGVNGRYVAKLQKGSPYPSDSYKNAPDHTPKGQREWPEEVNAIYNACMREDRGKGDSKEEKESSCAAIAWAQYNKSKGHPQHSDKDK